MYIPIKLYFISILSLCHFIFNHFLFLFPFYSCITFKNTAAISHRCLSCFYHEIILFLCRCRLDDMHTYKKQNKYRKEYCKPKWLVILCGKGDSDSLPFFHLYLTHIYIYPKSATTLT